MKGAEKKMEWGSSLICQRPGCLTSHILVTFLSIDVSAGDWAGSSGLFFVCVCFFLKICRWSQLAGVFPLPPSPPPCCLSATVSAAACERWIWVCVSVLLQRGRERCLCERR